MPWRLISPVFCPSCSGFFTEALEHLFGCECSNITTSALGSQLNTNYLSFMSSSSTPSVAKQRNPVQRPYLKHNATAPASQAALPLVAIPSSLAFKNFFCSLSPGSPRSPKISRPRTSKATTSKFLP